MGLKISTDEKGIMVFANEKEGKNGKFTLYSLPISRKDKEGKWESAYIQCVFKKGVVVNNKAKIKFDNAFPTFDKFNGTTYKKIMIPDFEIIEDGESSGDGWVNMDGISDSDLPFAD